MADMKPSKGRPNNYIINTRFSQKNCFLTINENKNKQITWLYKSVKMN